MLIIFHASFAIISILGLVIRAILSLKGSALLEKKFVRISPHIIDTLLFGSGIYLAIQYSRSGADLNWLWFKLGLILTYIVLAIFSMRIKKTNLLKFFLWGLTLLIGFLILYIAAHRISLLDLLSMIKVIF